MKIDATNFNFAKKQNFTSRMVEVEPGVAFPIGFIGKIEIENGLTKVEIKDGYKNSMGYLKSKYKKILRLISGAKPYGKPIRLSRYLPKY